MQIHQNRFTVSTVNSLFPVECKFTVFPSCSDFKLSHPHFRTVSLPFNLGGKLLCCCWRWYDAGFCSWSWGVRPSSHCEWCQQRQTESLLCKDVHRLSEALASGPVCKLGYRVTEEWSLNVEEAKNICFYCVSVLSQGLNKRRMSFCKNYTQFWTLLLVFNFLVLSAHQYYYNLRTCI